MRSAVTMALGLALCAPLGAQTQPTSAPAATAEAQAPHAMPDRMGDEQMMALIQAMEQATLPEPGEGGFLTPPEEEAARDYFAALMAIDARIREVHGGRQITEVTDEMVAQLAESLGAIAAVEPPAIADPQASSAFATFHSSLAQMGQALGEFIQHMPRGEVTPEMHAEMVPAANAFQQRMHSIMEPMLVSAQQVEQIARHDLGDWPMNDFHFGGLIN